MMGLLRLVMGLTLAAVAVQAQFISTTTPPSWSKVAAPIAPAATAGHLAIVNQTSIVTVGGTNAATGAMMVYTSIDGKVTTATAAAGTLRFDRAASTPAPDNAWQYVFGGVDPTSGAEVNTLWRVSTTSLAATVLSANGASTAPTARKLANLVYLADCPGTATIARGDCLLVTGGDARGVRQAGHAVYYLGANAWDSPANLRGSPSPIARTGAAAVAAADGSIAYMYGGDTASGLVDEVWAMAHRGFSDPQSSCSFSTGTCTEAVNLALGQPTNVSSIDTVSGTQGSAVAVDGNVATAMGAAPGKCTLSNSTLSDAWFMVDLGTAQRIDFVAFYVRSDLGNDGGALNAGFKLLLSNSTLAPPTSLSTASARDVPTGMVDVYVNPAIIRVGDTARYVWIYLPGPSRVLSVCELQVWQAKQWQWRLLSGLFNAAVLKPATQSSTLNGWENGDAARAVNGVFQNTVSNQYCSSTGNQEPLGSFVWWQVDLGAQYDVSSIAVWGRGNGNANRNTGISWYVGSSRDAAFGTYCTASPADITPPTNPGSRSFACAARGRYITARKVSTANDLSFITLCQVAVYADRLLDVPAARSMPAYTAFQNSLVIFGGNGGGGSVYSDVRFFDMTTASWRAPAKVLNTPPVGRSMGVLAPVLQRVAGGFSAPPNQLLLFGGNGATDLLNDVTLLSFPTCPSLSSQPVALTMGVASEKCTQAGTVCYYTCISGFVSATNGAPLVCGPDGSWAPTNNPCIGLSKPGAPVSLTATAITGTNNMALSWQPPASLGQYGGVSGYRITTSSGAVLDTFSGSGTVLPPSFTWYTPYPTATASTYQQNGGKLWFSAAKGADTANDVLQAPMMVRDWPAGVNVNSFWTIETQVVFDTTQNVPVNGFEGGLGLVDVSKYGNVGALEAIVGLKYVAGTGFQLGVEGTVSGAGSVAPWSYPAVIATSAWSIGQGTINGSSYLRLSREANTVLPTTMACAKDSENWPAILQCPANHVISSVDFAFYGGPTGVCGAFVQGSCGGLASRDISAFINTNCKGRNSCAPTITNAAVGDACPGFAKTFSVQATCSPIQCSTAPENSALSLTCPAGMYISAVQFADWGSPSGSCTAFSNVGGCGHLSLINTLNTKCLGRTSCTHTPQWTVDGDPCPGTAKSSAAQVLCTPYPALYNGYYRQNDQDTWRLIGTVVDPNFRNRAITLSNLRPALQVKNPSTASRAVIGFSYLRIAATQCVASGTLREITGTNAVSTIVYGLTPSTSYSFSVSALGGPQGYGPIATTAATVAAFTPASSGGVILKQLFPQCYSGSCYGGCPSGYPCANANDGNVNSLYHSDANGLNPWSAGWSASGEWIGYDLGVSTFVAQVQVWNRRDCCWSRVNNWQIWVGAAGPASNPFTANTLVYQDSSASPSMLLSPWMQTVTVNQWGRYVYLKIPYGNYLNLGEFNVYTATCPARTGNNIATRNTACNGDGGVGSACIMTCAAGTVLVSGSLTATCTATGWDSPVPVCMPVCADLFPPALGGDGGCEQSIFYESFLDTTGFSSASNQSSLNRWASLDPVNQAIGDKWFVADSALIASTSRGCSDNLYAVIFSNKIRSYTGAFRLSASISATDAAGLIWAATATGNRNMYRAILDPISQTVSVDKVINGWASRIIDAPLSIPSGSFVTLTVSQSSSNINVTVNGALVLTTVDGQLAGGGYMGVYALSSAKFTAVSVTVPCSQATGCSGAVEQDTCSFACHDGWTASGPTTRRCVNSGGSYVWSPSPISQPLTCTLPNPVIYSTSVSVPENSERNAVVGDPLVATSTAPDYPLQWAITGATPAAAQDYFWIDSCSGQLKVRVAGGARTGLFDFEIVKPYMVEVRAYLLGSNAATSQNITVFLTNVDEPPVVVDTVVNVTENTNGVVYFGIGPNTIVGTPFVWDPENSTVSYSLVVDGAAGRFAVRNDTGNITLTAFNPSLDFEGAVQPASFTLQVQAVQRNDTRMLSVGRFIINVLDANDPPVITPSQIMVVNERSAASGAAVGWLQYADQDVGAFASSLSVSLLSTTAALADPKCSFTNLTTGVLYPTTTGASGGSTALFTSNSSGYVTFNANYATAWAGLDPYLIGGVLARAAFTACFRVTDGFGASDTRSALVVVAANGSFPQITSVSQAATMSTAGGETVFFSGSGFLPSMPALPVRASYSNALGQSYTAASCAVLSDTQMSCATVPGWGVGYSWTVQQQISGVGWKTVVAGAVLSSSYTAPTVTAVAGNVAVTTRGNVQLNFTGNNFGPPNTPIIIKYGAAFENTCATASAATTHTFVTCTLPAGTGKDLPWSLTVGYTGGQAAASTPATLISYAPPTITTVAPYGTSVNYTMQTLDTAGGSQQMRLTGSNFGPAGSARMLTFGGAAGTLVTVNTCTEAADSHTGLICTIPAGVGTGHRLMLTVGGQSLSAAFPAAAASTFAYLPPYITSVTGPGASNADSGGGQAVYISGRYFGPISYPITTIDVVHYGHVGDESRYTAADCRVTTEGALSVITCVTAPGVGRGHAWYLSIGGQTSPIFNAGTSYSAPQVIGFSQAGAADADTRGNQVVAISGRNFGPADPYTSARLAIQYAATLQNGPYRNLTFFPATCFISIAHVEVTCTTAEGAGRELTWSVAVDGQASRNPTTNYHAPVINSIEDAAGQPITAADVNGGTQAYLVGDFFSVISFGPDGLSLLQQVSYGPTGQEYVLPANRFALSTAHTRIAVTLLPGAGSGLSFRVSVADQLSLSSTATFSYAAPVIVGVYPAEAPTFSPPGNPQVVTIVARNLPLLDLRSRLALSFCAGAMRQTRTLLVPTGAQAIAAATNTDGSVNVTFTLPQQGLGQNLPIQLSVLQSDTVVAITDVTAASTFSYSAAVIDDVVVTRALFSAAGSPPTANSDVLPCPFTAGSAWSCDDPNIFQLTLLGRNLGADPVNTPGYTDGVTRTMELFLFANQFVGELWSWEDGTVAQSDSLAHNIIRYSWSHTRLVYFVRITAGRLRLTITTPGYTTWNGVPAVQTLLANFSSLSPTVSNLGGATSNLPTAGGRIDEPLIITADELQGTDDLTVMIGPNRAQLVKPSGSTYVALATAADVKTYLASCCGAGPWTVYAQIPPGQGSNVAVQIIRTIGSTVARSNVGFSVSYAPPVLTAVRVSQPDGSWTTYTAASFATVIVPTDGSASVRIVGSNLGTAPVLHMGDGGIVATVTECAGSAATHTCWEGATVPGEGDGKQFPEYLPNGYRVWLSAADQDSGSMNFAYATPIVTGVQSDTTAFPTRGGTQLSIIGKNFGVGNPVRAAESQVLVVFFPASAPSAAVPCESIQRVSHTVIRCILPEGAGKSLTVGVTVAGLSTSTPALLSYDRPIINASAVLLADSASLAAGMPETDSDWLALLAAAPDAQVGLALGGNTTGGDVMVLTGANFGTRSAMHCAFLTWSQRSADPTRVHTCNDGEDFLGEGEVPAGNVLAWSHELVVLRVPPGVGIKELELSITGNTLGLSRSSSALVRYVYNGPVITLLRPAQGNVEGGDVLVVEGYNFGPTPRNTSNSADRLTSEVFSPPIPLDQAPALSTAFLGLGFHASCASSARDLFGLRPAVAIPVTGGTARLDSCTGAILSHAHNRLVFQLPAGVGVNKSVTVSIVDGATVFTSNDVRFSYYGPSIDRYSPNIAYVDALTATPTSIDILGAQFGNAELAVAQGWSASELYLDANVGGFGVNAIRRRREDGTTIVTIDLSIEQIPAGNHNVTLQIAGQTAFQAATPVSRALLVVCAYGSYAHVNETCRPCPAQSTNALARGAECRGYQPSMPGSFEARFTYPRPLPGFYNLNSSDSYTRAAEFTGSMLDICPEGMQDGGRDVCIVACEPSNACLGDNHCEEGYTSKAPMWRCASCDTGFYKRAGECVKCPNSPAALFIGFILLVMVLAVGGFLLNKKQVNIAVISIGIDFFQVLAIFAQARIAWPPAVKELLHVLSAFNLNIEIVAPECLIPNVSYKQKFWFIMILPLCVAFLLLLVFLVLACNKACIKRREKKRWFSHKPTLLSSTLVLTYMLYLYLTRTALDVFNCTPTFPSDGYTYLQVVFERCGVPGGTQLTLLPYAIAGLAVYTAGYPSFIGYKLYKNRELVMEDQLLRAKGAGNDRLSNPHAYHFRKAYGRAYFQFKPDWSMWILAIVVRKFLIALTAVIFNKNSSFQMAACLLIMFLAYAAQVQVRPYLSPSEYDDVLRDHVNASFHSAIHARLRSVIANIETRGRKRARRNLMTATGQIDRSAVLGVLSGWLFNYNTVEAVMSFAAVIVCLMAIMYQANEVNTQYPGSKDSVTTVVLVVVALAIVYFFTVLITEIVVLYNEESREKALRATALRAAKEKGRKDGEAGSAGRSARGGKLVGDSGEVNTGKLENQMNPLFMTKQTVEGGASGGADLAAGGSSGLVATIVAQREAPPLELWRVFQSTFVDQVKQLDDMRAALQLEKKLRAEAEQGTRGNRPTTADEEAAASGVAVLGRIKTGFSPQTVSGVTSGSNPLAVNKSAMRLSSLRAKQERTD